MVSGAAWVCRLLTVGEVCNEINGGPWELIIKDNKCLLGNTVRKPLCSSALWVLGLSAWRRQQCYFLWLSPIRVHPIPATSTMSPKFDPNEIKVNVLKIRVHVLQVHWRWGQHYSCLGQSVYEKKLVMTLPKELVTRKWSWPSRTDRPRLRWCLLSLPWSPKPSRSHQETEISKRTLNTMEMSLLTRSSTLPG